MVLQRLVKNCHKGTKQAQLALGKAKNKPPFKVKYLCVEDDRAALVTQLQSQIYDLENKAERANKSSAQPCKSPRSVRRYKRKVPAELKTLTGKEHVITPKESPTKTSIKFDKASVSLRRYRQGQGPEYWHRLIKDRHQCPVSSVSEVRSSLNSRSNDIKALLVRLLENYTCATPSRVKVSVDGHDPSRCTVTRVYSVAQT